jgi:pyridinium-3,5-bisthiocarboxylic acid mononucleotide nickel chelatase
VVAEAAPACWIDASAGVAGDMLLAALIDAGADEDRVREAIASLGVAGIGLHTTEDRRGGFRCRRAHVAVPAEDRTHRHLAEIHARIDASALGERGREVARRTFALLAAAEGQVHGMDPAEVHFHEVGAHDALADVVGTVTAAEDLGLLRDGAEIVCSALAAGSGTVRSEHGLLPVPTPAVVHLAAQHGLALDGGDLQGERSTPTGAALVAALARPGDFPAMTVHAVGTGGGRRDTVDRPNITRVVLGARRSGAPGSSTREAIVLEATVDDLDPQLWPSVLRAVRAAGAWDCWTTPMIARHGRPGHVLTAICEETMRRPVADAVLRHTSTSGVRWSTWQRESLPRSSTTVEVGPPDARRSITVKTVSLDSGVRRSKPEISDVEAAAEALDLPVAAVYAEAVRRCQELDAQ